MIKTISNQGGSTENSLASSTSEGTWSGGTGVGNPSNTTGGSDIGGTPAGPGPTYGPDDGEVESNGGKWLRHYF